MTVNPGGDHFVFNPGIGAETVANFNWQQDTIELDQFTNAQTTEELQSLIASDAHGDAVIQLGHNDSIVLSGVTTSELQQVIQAGHVLLHETAAPVAFLNGLLGVYRHPGLHCTDIALRDTSLVAILRI